MREAPVSHKIPPELIEEYERERTEVVFEPGDFENAKEPETPVEAAEYFLLESDTNRDMWADLDATAMFELRQEKGTRMLHVVEVSQDGDKVTYRASDGSHGVTTGSP